ncbi:MAG: carboxypeptidase regulatory-like domain-containing protein [Planctomycetes bacterium]|nr:carboxypeptidase regulatory-like domain-containing protein [Planctomycetota bacterium]
MRRELAVILGITVLVVALVLLLGPFFSQIRRGVPKRTNSIGILPSDPQGRTGAPTEKTEAPEISVRLRARFRDAVTDEPVRVIVTFVGAEWTKAMEPSSVVTGQDGFLDAVFSVLKTSCEMRVEAFDEQRYSPQSRTIVAPGGTLDLGVVELDPKPWLQILANDGKQLPNWEVYAVRDGIAEGPCTYTGSAGAKKWVAVVLPEGARQRSGLASHFIEFESAPGLKKLILPEPPPVVLESLPFTAVTKNGFVVERVAYELYAVGPYGLEFRLAEGQLYRPAPLPVRLSAGSYRILLRRLDGEQWTTQLLQVESGADPNTLQFVLPDAPGAKVRITRSGVPVVGLQVTLGGDWPWMFPLRPGEGVLTNQAGEAYFSRLEPGRYRLRGVGPRLAPLVVDVDEGRVTEVDFDLDERRGSVVRGRFSCRERYWKSKPRWICFVDASTAEEVGMDEVVDVPLREDGTFELLDVPPGEYFIYVEKRAIDWHLERRWSLSVSPERDYDVDLQFPLFSLRASWPVPTEGDPGIIYLRLLEADGYWNGKACGDDAYWDALFPGKYVAFARVNEGSWAYSRINLTESDCKSVEWVFLDSLDDWPDDLPPPPVRSRD